MNSKKRVCLLSLFLIVSVAHFVGAADKSIDDAFIAAVMEKDVNKVKKLLDKGADIDATGMMGQTGLIMAASERQADMVELLIERGCKLNVSDVFGSTALHMGVGSYEITKMLLSAGADPWKLNKSGDNALDFAAAVYTDKIETLDLFLKLKPGQELLNKALASAAHGGNTKKLNRMVKAGADINSPDGETSPLIVASNKSVWTTARELLRIGARIDQRDESGRTPLYHAVENENEGMARLLIQYGANPRITPKGKMSALVISLIDENFEISRMLAAAGADINDDFHGEPAIDVVKMRGPGDLAEFMQKGSSEKLKKEMMLHAPFEKMNQGKIKKLIIGEWKLEESETELHLYKKGAFRWSIEGFLSKKVLEGDWRLKNGDLNLHIKKSTAGDKGSTRRLGIAKIDENVLEFGFSMDPVRYKKIGD